MELIVGNIYEIDFSDYMPPSINKIRVLLVDEYQVFFDHFGFYGWFYTKLNSTCVFARNTIAFYSPRATLLEVKPLTAEEKEVYRPDLLLRIARYKQLSWNDEILTSQSKINDFINNATNNLPQVATLNTNKVYLQPIGKGGGFKTMVLVEADNGKYFTTAELLYKANQIQSKVNPNRSNGVGIFRNGIRKKTPTYYIGEYIDLAGSVIE